jgi:hypothetical protein
MDLVTMGKGGVHWIGVAQDRENWRTLVNCGNEPSGSIKCCENIEWLHSWWDLE